MDDRPRFSAYSSYDFLLEIQGKIRAGFSACVGLRKEEARAFKFDNSKNYSGLQPQTLVLEQGSTDNLYLWDWYSEILGGEQHKQTLTILKQGPDGELKRWRLADAWLTDCDGQALSVDGNTIEIKSLCIYHEGAESLV